MTKAQSLENKKGEVDFRRKLALQFEGKTQFFPGAPNAIEFNQIIKDRVKNYKSYFKDLNKRGILETPYLEIGGGVGQGSMLLENKYQSEGFISDLSLETLQLAPKYLRHLRYKKMPFRVCCDAYNLPFLDNSLSFVFCFETLHHFPDPSPILQEIKRVLKPGSYFYFNEEPVSQIFNLNFWRRDQHLRWFEKILKYMIILHFISKIGKSEVENDILEGTFDLKTWEKALDNFKSVSANLAVFPFKFKMRRTRSRFKEWLEPGFPIKIFLNLLGGGIEALCQKKPGVFKKFSPNNLIDILACPNCTDKPKLVCESKRLFCKKCGVAYFKKNGIFILLSSQQLKKLYP